ncbi:MAG TPA: cupin domain-containing protein [Gaiellaceae bacterium]|nr:cupin domain-containing protein [Gaiellaceae bacterium]
MRVEDVLAVELASGRPVPTALAGEPYESWRVLFDDGRVELGVWEVTPGSFAASCAGFTEQMHFVAGSGTITGADGTTAEIRPGAVLVLPDGWSGRWDVRETVRKSYAVVKTA